MIALCDTEKLTEIDDAVAVRVDDYVFEIVSSRLFDEVLIRCDCHTVEEK